MGWPAASAPTKRSRCFWWGAVDLSRCLIAACTALILACLPTLAEAASPPVRLGVSFGAGARLGKPAAVNISLSIDSKRVAAPVTEFQMLTPAGLDLTSSGLGIATCRLASTAFQGVLVGSATVVPCPANAVLGYGTATAELRLDNEERPIMGYANLTLFSGATQDKHPGLVVFAAAINPVSTGLVYTGHLFTAPRPFGLGMLLKLPLVPDAPFGATISLVRVKLGIGTSRVVYTKKVRGKRVSYRPGGVTLPRRCPRGGFRFRVKLGFADASRRTVNATVKCPRA